MRNSRSSEPYKEASLGFLYIALGRKGERDGGRKKRENRASETAQWVKITITKSDNLRAIPGTYVVEGEIDSYKLSSNLHICTINVRTHTHREKKI